jgi:D-alanyl-D-alanine-carboxypeptidase/D-alanyl-D-alanine-endopeptidase
MRYTLLILFSLLFSKSKAVEKKSNPKPSNYGLSVGIISNGVEYIYCYGDADRIKRIPVDTNSIFEIGSLTKLYTGLLFSKEVVEKRMKLDESAFSYMTGIVKKEEISLIDLATHSSGLPRLADNFHPVPADSLNPYHSYSEKELYQYMAGYKVISQPGKHYNYSNVGMGLLGNILCHTRKMSYNDMVQKTICEPWGLANTATLLNETQVLHLAKGHSMGKEVPAWDFLDATAGQGALRSSIKDMVRFIHVNLYPESLPYLQMRAVKLAQELHFSDTTTGQQMGIGWHIGLFNQSRLLEHTGATGGYRSYIGLIPDSKIGVVLLSNSDADISGLGIKILNLIQKATSSL